MSGGQKSDQQDWTVLVITDNDNDEYNSGRISTLEDSIDKVYVDGVHFKFEKIFLSAVECIEMPIILEQKGTVSEVGRGLIRGG